jgi:hypothetical protein
MCLSKEAAANLVKDLGLNIVSEDLLVSNIPIPVLAFKKENLFFLEFLFDKELKFIEDHFRWIKENEELLKSKFRLKNISGINLICLAKEDNEFNIELPGFKGELDVYKCSFSRKSSRLEPFDNWTLNRGYLKNKLEVLTSKVSKEDKDIIFGLLDSKPLFIREEFKDYFLIKSKEQYYRLRLFKDFIWLHKGGAPFKPRKISIKS